MTAEDFVKEVQESDFYYPEFENEYSSFLKYQKLALQTLNEFHRVCENNNINYALAYGSLLGVVRDHGQIPWDYDIDVVIDIQDRERLIDALNEYLSDDFYFICSLSNPMCLHYIIRLAPKGYNSLDLHVDVFYAVGIPEEENERKEIFTKLKRCTIIRRNKLRDLKRVWKVSKKKFIVYQYIKLRFLFTSLKSINEQFEEASHRYPLITTKNCIIPEYQSIMDSKDFIDTKLIELDSGTYRIPVYYDDLLTKWYGDYHRIMPLEERLNEMRIHYNNLRRFGKE